MKFKLILIISILLLFVGCSQNIENINQDNSPHTNFTSTEDQTIVNLNGNVLNINLENYLILSDINKVNGQYYYVIVNSTSMSEYFVINGYQKIGPLSYVEPTSITSNGNNDIFYKGILNNTMGVYKNQDLILATNNIGRDLKVDNQGNIIYRYSNENRTLLKTLNNEKDITDFINSEIILLSGEITIFLRDSNLDVSIYDINFEKIDACPRTSNIRNLDLEGSKRVIICPNFEIMRNNFYYGKEPITTEHILTITPNKEILTAIIEDEKYTIRKTGEIIYQTERRVVNYFQEKNYVVTIEIPLGNTPSPTRDYYINGELKAQIQNIISGPKLTNQGNLIYVTSELQNNDLFILRLYENNQELHSIIFPPSRTLNEVVSFDYDNEGNVYFSYYDVNIEKFKLYKNQRIIAESESAISFIYSDNNYFLIYIPENNTIERIEK